MNGFGQMKDGRGNIAPNTIILPKLGIEFGTCLGKRTEPDLKGFWDAFEETLKLCEKGLLERFEIMMWISLDKGVYIHVTEDNANSLIKYLYERYPY